MKEIAINKLGDSRELNIFIEETNKKVLSLKGIVVATDDDIKPISANIKELKQREDILKIAEGKLIELAGIKQIGIAIENSRSQRLIANKIVQNAKQEIKNEALDFFILNANELISNSKDSSCAYKQSLDVKKIASEAISGRSKGFMELMKRKLNDLKSGLDLNGKETKAKLTIMNGYDHDLTYRQFLTQLTDDILETTLNERKNNKQAKIEYEAQKLADQKLADQKLADQKLAQIESDQIDQEIDNQIDQETEDEIERVRLEKIEKADQETLAIQAKEDAIKKDAMRYRHLKDKDVFSIKELSQQGISALFVGRIPENLILAGEDLDEAIDNEMKLMEKA